MFIIDEGQQSHLGKVGEAFWKAADQLAHHHKRSVKTQQRHD